MAVATNLLSTLVTCASLTGVADPLNISPATEKLQYDFLKSSTSWLHTGLLPRIVPNGPEVLPVATPHLSGG